MIRQATLSDAPMIAAMARETYYHTYTSIDESLHDVLSSYVKETFTVASVEAEISSFYLLINKDQVAGYSKIKEMWLEKLYLNKEFLGQGLGKVLFEHAKKVITDHGFKIMSVAVYDQNLAAIRFYEKLGFKKVGEQRFTYKGYEDCEWLMELAL